ncbi:MAG: transposase, partial [Candidatus Rokuibacteriota bacterium]
RAGPIRAVETCFPRALRQRCLAHRLRNLRSKAPDSQWPEIAIRARACYEAAAPALATVLREDFGQVYGRELPGVVQCFVDDFDAGIAHLRAPLRHRKVIRTTNLLERLFLEERRRTKMVPHAFGERPVLKLMYAAVIRAADRWRGITAGEFEQRQLRAIRTELDRAHAERVAPAVGPATSPRKLRVERCASRPAAPHLAPERRSGAGPLSPPTLPRMSHRDVHRVHRPLGHPADLGLDRRRFGGDGTIPQFGDTGREPDASDLIYFSRWNIGRGKVIQEPSSQ